MSERTRKLIALRSRTDQDLVLVVHRELDRGFALLNTLVSRNSLQFPQAEKALATASALLPRINGLSETERLEIEGKRNELRARLDHVSMYANARPYLTSFAS